MLIENVLDFAKVERGKAAYDFTTADVGDVVARAVEACRVRSQRDKVDLVLDVSEGIPNAELDERAIEIAIINLVDNALKYAPDSDRVVISARESEGFAEIRVTDRGPGIAAEDRKRIFERFVRGKTALNKQVRGSGIGLALVKHIAEAHGGRAWVEAVAPHGSAFVLTIRLGDPSSRPAFSAREATA